MCIKTFEDAGYEVDARDKVEPSDLVSMIQNYDALVVRSGTQVTSEVLSAGASRLKVVGRAGTGVDNIDVDAATAAGIMVMNTPGGNTTSAAELTVSLLMALSRDIPAATSSLKAGRWDRKKYMGTELEGKTLGLVGLGQIGRRVAAICRAMGMQTIGYDPLLSADAAAAEQIGSVDLETLFAQSDFISLHTPLTPETRGLLNAETLATCKEGVRIVNCARGGIVDEADLLDALNTGKVAGAALDVYESEPPPESLRPLLEHERCICTPHLGASTEEAQLKVAKDIASQIVDVFEGRAVRGVVNSRILAELMQHKDLLPFVELAERIGALLIQLRSDKVKSVTLTTRGDTLKGKASILQAAALKGMLAPMVEEPVNFINAPSMAAEFGLSIAEVHENKPSRHGNELTLTIEGEAETRSAVGTVTGRGTTTPLPRIVALDSFAIDLTPQGNVMYFRNDDKPGVIGSICSMLGEESINVASFALGRKETGDAVGVVSVDTPVPDSIASQISSISGMRVVRTAKLPSLSSDGSAAGGGVTDDSMPVVRPKNPNFGSGPCTKRPGYDLAKISTAVLGRSHRSTEGLAVLNELAEESHRILGLPEDYHIGIIPGSDTGAFEAAMWNLLGPKPVDIVHFESFGTGWYNDAAKQLKLGSEHGGPGIHEFAVDAYGQFPDVSAVNPDHDLVFTFNGTTSGVRVPAGVPFISDNRSGITLCDATSAVFAMDMPWNKLDVTTYSWQKALGGEAAHGTMVLSPAAVERLESYAPAWPMPKVFNLRKGDGSANLDPFKGKVINTPSLLAVEDCLDALRWADSIGGLDGMIAVSKANLGAVEAAVAKHSWLSFLAKDAAIRSNTSVCLQIEDASPDQVKAIVSKLASERIAYDIGAYRDAPPGLRIWCGSTVETEDVAALMDWLAWAHDEVMNGN